MEKLQTAAKERIEDAVKKHVEEQILTVKDFFAACRQEAKDEKKQERKEMMRQIELMFSHQERIFYMKLNGLGGLNYPTEQKRVLKEKNKG